MKLKKLIKMQCFTDLSWNDIYSLGNTGDFNLIRNSDGQTVPMSLMSKNEKSKQYGLFHSKKSIKT